MLKGYIVLKGMEHVPKYFIMVVILLLSFNSIAGHPSILIIKSSENSFFNKTIQQLTQKIGDKVEFHIKMLDSLEHNDPLLSNSRAIITLGIAAANYPFDKKQKSPIIHSYITEFQLTKHTDEHNHHYLLLDQPLHRYLAFIKYLLAPKAIAIIKSEKNAVNKKTLKRLSSSLGIKLEQRLMKKGDNPLRLVRNLLHSNDVLLSLPNPDVYNRRSLKGILLASYRQNKPMISYSPAHVKSGALAAIYSSPDDIGNQLAGIIKKIISRKNAKLKTVYYASEFNISINHRVAKSLGLTLDNEELILKKLTASNKK